MHQDNVQALLICESTILTQVVVTQFAGQKHVLSLEACKKNSIDHFTEVWNAAMLHKKITIIL